MNKILIQNPRIINEGRSFIGSVLVEGDKIAAVFEGEVPGNVRAEANQVIDATGKWLIPGVIDDQVHFRDPGLTHKGDIGTESRAAVAGGVTTFMDMPNTKPQTTTIADLEWKFNRAAEVSRANYSFFFGGTNDNMDEIRRLDRSRVPGLKLFLGSSTGNMLVDKKDSLERIFGEAGMLIAIHAEKEEVIRRNIQYYTNLHGEDLDVVLMQMVNLMRDGQPVRMSKRTGNAITLTDLLEEVPIDSARFLFNMHDAGSGIDFDLDQAVKTDNDNPVYYVQYAHARICSILKKMESEGVAFAGAEQVDATLLTDPSEMDLIRMLAAFPQEIVMAAEKYDPSRINRFVIDLASAFHRFYGNCRIQGADPAVQQARLALCIGVKNVIFNVLTMFKINVPEKM